MSPDDYCAERAARSGSSFYYSFLFLPPERRRAITAFYAFCREVDDIVDDCREIAVAHTSLQWWRGEVAAMFADRPTHPVGRALQPFIAPMALPREAFLEVIDGMESDLGDQRFADFPALERYCHCVAGVVGQVSARIFGYSEDATLDYAHQLGIAFQLTNLIRDVGEDARRGRVYLPEDDLARFSLTRQDILQLRPGPQFAALMAFQTERAQDYYRRAFAALPAADRRRQRAGLIMAAIYRALLTEIARDGYRVMDQRIALTPLRKLWLAWTTWIRG